MSAPFYLESKSKRSSAGGRSQRLTTPKTVGWSQPSPDLDYSLANVPTHSGVAQRVRKKRKVGDNNAIRAVDVSEPETDDKEEERKRKVKHKKRKDKFVREYNKARENRKTSKDKFEQDTLKTMPQKDKKRIVFNDYKDTLESLAPKDYLEKKGFNFGEPSETGLHEVKYKGDLVGHFATGPSAFKKKSDATDTTRELWSKDGTPGTVEDRNYVLDDRGTVTREDAFAEKNYYQGIELATSGKIKGRWQQLHQALGYTPDWVHDHLHDPEGTHPEFVKARNDDRVKPTEDLTLSELAMSHQWLGNGTQQRGNSLTSTPRTGAVYSNDGDPFRNSAGLRLQYDLSRVKKSDNNTLINHYGQTNLDNRKSVKDSSPLTDGVFYRHERDGRTTNQFADNYANSVDKNREIYLEETRLKDISGINFHKGDDNANDVTPVLTDDPEETRKTIKTQLHYDKFKEGFDGYKSDEDIPDSGANSDDEAVIKGKKYARSYHSGRKRGKDWRRRSRKSASFKDLETYFGHNDKQHEKYGIKDAEAKDFYHDIYRIGWAHEAAEEEREKNKDLIGYKPGEKITLNPGLFGEPFK